MLRKRSGEFLSLNLVDASCGEVSVFAVDYCAVKLLSYDMRLYMINAGISETKLDVVTNFCKRPEM